MRVETNRNGPFWNQAGSVAEPASARPGGVANDTAALLLQASRAARNALDAVSSNLQFLTDPHSGRTVVQVIDAKTRQVIRQLPSEEALAITKAIDRLQSLLVREQA
jgi:flagellar protein FlaG